MPSPAACSGSRFLTSAWSADLFNSGSPGGLVSWLGTLPECITCSISYSLLWNLPIVCAFKKIMCVCVCACVYCTSTQGSQKRWLEPLELELVNRQLWVVWVLGTKLGLSRNTVCAELLSRSAPLCFYFSYSPFYKLPSRLNCSYVSYKDIAMVCFHCITIPLWSRGLNLSVVQAVFALLSSQASCALFLFFLL